MSNRISGRLTSHGAIDEKLAQDLWGSTFTALTAARSFSGMTDKQAAEEARRLFDEDKYDPEEIAEWFDSSIKQLEAAIESFKTGRRRLRSGIALNRIEA